MGKKKWKIAQKVEIAWWKRYLKTKDKRQYYAWKEDYWNTFLEKCSLKIKDSDSILDAGSGPAGIFIALSGHKVTAVDPLLDQYQKKLAFFYKGDHYHTSFVTSKLEKYKRSDDFDIIFCLNVINHVEDIKQVLDNLFDSLKKGGTMIMSTDAHNFTILKTLFQWLPGDVLHPQQYTHEEYRNLITGAGFEVMSTDLLKKERIFSYYNFVCKKSSK